MRAADEHGESHAFGAGRNLKAHQSISVHLTRGRSRWGFGDPPKELEFVLLPLPGTFLPYLDRYMYLYLPYLVLLPLLVKVIVIVFAREWYMYHYSSKPV